MNKRIVKIACIILCLNHSVNAQNISSLMIDTTVEKVLKAFNVPGISVGVVKDGQLIHAKGYGVRNINTHEKVNENTLFGIASNSKAFTTAALGMLVDEGKIKWDDKVTDYLPDFRLYNSFVTEEFTVRDLLCHRSGLGLGAGDLMMFPDSNTFTKQDIIHNLRYLKPVSSFRTKFDYDNNLYIVAGEIIEKVSGLTWEEFIEKRIMQPLGMTQSYAAIQRIKDKSNIVAAHAPLENKIVSVRNEWSQTADAAGGIWSNITDLSKWVNCQINNGKYGADLSKILFSESVHDDMWTPQTVIPVNGPTAYNTHFSSYGLGWFLSDVKGYKQTSHTGGLYGIVTQVTIIPELKLGIIVLTNQESGAAFTAITNTIKDFYLGMKPIDRVQQQLTRVQKNEADANKIKENIWKEVDSVQKANPIKPNLDMYLGTYTDQWFGDVEISKKNNSLWFQSKRSYYLRGEMMPYKGNTFIVKWLDRAMDADAYVQFELDFLGNTEKMKMNAISPSTDFSFDFQDLDFVKKK